MSAFKGHKYSSALLGSAFLMATSAIGPGFITQTTVFTEKLRTSFGFVILCSVILDIIVQLNIWRVLTVSGLRAQDLANTVKSGTGHVLTFLIVLGGLAFNIGNIAGAGLGLQIVTGLALNTCVVICACIAFIIFLYKEAGKALDLFSKILGVLMILLTAYIAFSSRPPLLQAIHHSFLPEQIDTTAIMVLVGGTVGGYISFAGAHRLLDAGITGLENVKSVTNAGVKAILLASVMRVLLFLAALGVVVHGVSLRADNPAASIFETASGQAGLFIFGIVLWAASITSVVGSAYTSVSFFKTFPSYKINERIAITLFIIVSTVIFLIVGRPVQVLVIVGALNAFVLPFALALILIASRKTALMGSYRHPRWLIFSGWAVVIIITIISIVSLSSDLF
jgi:Mn2+/Fe2+ NRAMP family transporter